MPPFDLAAYLERIGLPEIEHSADGLLKLQSAQLRAVPFENFDVLTGTIPALEPDAVFRKLVRERRGGYCFELNQLLESALVASGFKVRRSLGRVRKGAPTGGPRCHLALITQTGGRTFLMDTGFGGPGSLLPLELGIETPQVAPNGTYRVTGDNETGERVVWKQTATGWYSLFSFDDAWVGDADIAAANLLCATWDHFPFTGHLTLGGYDDSSRIGIFDRMLTIESAGEPVRRALADFREFEEVATGRLGIRASRDLLETVWNRIPGS